MQTTRRAVLLGAMGTLALGGCRVRLEDDAPRVPGLPERQPVPDEAFLTRLVAELRSLATQATSPQLRTAHTEHAATLTRFLAAARVPSPTPSSPAAPVVERPDIAALAGLTTSAAATVRSIAAYRAMASARLGAPVTWPAVTAATSADAALLAALREAAYGLELAASRSGTAAESAQAPNPSATQRSRLLADVRWAQGRARSLVVRLGTQAPPPPLGYDITAPADGVAAKELAAQCFSRLTTAVGARLGDGGPASAVVVESLVAIDERGAAWGLTVPTWPGLVAPAPTATGSTIPTAGSTG